MNCKKSTITNTGPILISFSYRDCADGQWKYQVPLEVGEEKTFYAEGGTLYLPTLFDNNSDVIEVAFPPTPSNTRTPAATPTSTPTPSITQSNTPTRTPTKTPTKTPTGTPASTPDSTPTPTPTKTTTPTKTPTKTPTNTPTGTPASTPDSTPTPTPTKTPTGTPASTPDSTPTQTPSSTPPPASPSPTPSITPTNGAYTATTCNTALNEDLWVSGGTIGFFTIDITGVTQTGTTVLDYSAALVPDRFSVMWNGVEVINTGFVSNCYSLGTCDDGDPSLNQRLIDAGYPPVSGPNGSMSFIKSAETPSVVTIYVEAPLNGTVWSGALNCPV